MSGYYKYDLVSNVYEVLGVDEFGKQLVDDMVHLSVNRDPDNWCKMRIEIDSASKGPHAYNVTENVIFDSYQTWRGTSAGPMRWLRMNKTPIANDTIRSFYEMQVNKIINVTSSKDDFLSDDEEVKPQVKPQVKPKVKPEPLPTPTSSITQLDQLSSKLAQEAPESF